MDTHYVDNPVVGDLRTFPDWTPVRIVFPGTLQCPEIVMLGSHIWTGEGWMKIEGAKKNG